MNISLAKLRITIGVLESNIGDSFEDALCHRDKIHTIKLLAGGLILSSAEATLIEGAMDRAECFVTDAILNGEIENRAQQTQQEILRLLRPVDECPVAPVRNSVRVAEMFARSAKNEERRKRREKLRQ